MRVTERKPKKETIDLNLKQTKSYLKHCHFIAALLPALDSVDLVPPLPSNISAEVLMLLRELLDKFCEGRKA